MPFDLPPEVKIANAFARWIETTIPKELNPFTKSRRAEVVRVRRVCWYIMRGWGIKYRVIANLFKVDHSTIVVGVQHLTDRDKLYAKKIEHDFEQYALRSAL